MRLFTANPNKFFSTPEMVNLVWGDEYAVDSLKPYILESEKIIYGRARTLRNRISTRYGI